MRQFIAMLRKEIIETGRNYKLFILLTVFILFGFMNPIMAKIMPEIFKSVATEGIIIQIPEPTAADSFAQFFKNISQMGYIVLAILFSGITAAEISKGTLINLLSKGLSRRNVILSKFASSALLWTGALWLCLGITYLYTSFLWSMNGIGHVFAATSGLWLYGLFLIALTIFGGVIFSNIYGSLLFTGGTAVLLMFLSLFKSLNRFNPVTLSSSGLQLVTSLIQMSDYYPAMIVCAVMIIAIINASIFVFNKKQL